VFGLALHLPLFRQLCRLDRHGRDGPHEFPGECGIDAKPAEHHTPRRANRRIATVATVNGLAGPSGVDDTHPPAAPSTGEQPTEQGAAASTGFGAVLTAIGVGGKLLLIALELVPVDVALVMILQQDLAVLERTVVSVGLARPAINNLGSVDGFAVGVGAGMERVLQQRDDIAVADRRPIERRHSLAVRRTREMHPLGLERQVHLPGAAQLAEALEDSAGDLLDPAIRIEAKADLPMPDVADRHGNPELPSAGL
jgi:hypothetical protein